MNPDLEIAFPPARNYRPLPERGLLLTAGFDLALAERFRPRPLTDRPPFWGGLTRLRAGTDFFWAGPVLGAPMAVMALEELQRRGAREMVLLGLAGGLEPGLALGDLFCPEAGLSTEGTSAHYPAPLRPDENLRRRLLISAPESAGGLVWSTDGIFRETAGLVETQRERGARAVEMETTALWAAAAFRNVRLASLLVISDLLTGDGHQSGFHTPVFKAGMRRAAQAAWRALIAGKEERA